MIAWVTGGGSGIGRAVAVRLFREGAKVVITGRRQEALDRASREIAALGGGGDIFALAGDASESSHALSVVSEVKKRWGEIDLLVNNAGVNSNKNVSDEAFEEYSKAFQINCLSAINCVRHVLPDMLKNGHGSVVNISSVYGRWASSNSASYSVSKYALAGYTDALRQGLIDTPIHVMGVFPGFIQTDMTMPFVVPGSLRSRLGKTPDQMAAALLRALASKKAELYYPWYVPWVLRMHRWLPRASDRLARRVKR